MPNLTKREIALVILGDLFRTQSRVSIEEAEKLASARGVSGRTMRRAAHDLGVSTITNGPNSGYWERASSQ